MKFIAFLLNEIRKAIHELADGYVFELEDSFKDKISNFKYVSLMSLQMGFSGT